MHFSFIEVLKSPKITKFSYVLLYSSMMRLRNSRWFDIKLLLGFVRAINEPLPFPLPFKRQPHKVVKHIQTIRRQKPTNCLSVFDHFVGLAFKGLSLPQHKQIRYYNQILLSGTWRVHPHEHKVTVLQCLSFVKPIRNTTAL